MAQISLSFSGDFCPVSLSLFNGTRAAELLAVASMTNLLSGKGRVGLRRLPLGDTRPTFAIPLSRQRTLLEVIYGYAIYDSDFVM